MGFWHARALTRAGADLVLVVDQDVERARRLAGGYRRCSTASSADQLSAFQTQVAHVCTPTASHAAVIRTALGAGCHVIAEKPLADSAATTADLFAFAASRNRLLCPVHQVLFQRGTQQLLTVLDRLRPRHADLMICSAGARRGSNTADELVAEILPHPLSFLVQVFPGATESGEWAVSRAGAGEVRATLASPVGMASILISAHGRPPANAAHIIGEQGTAFLNFFHGFASFQDGAMSRTRKAVQPLVYSSLLARAAGWNLLHRALKRQTAYPGLWELVSLFYRRAQTGGPSPISAQATMHVAAMRDIVLAQMDR